MCYINFSPDLFGSFANIDYLCNMNTKNLYTNIRGLIRNALIISTLCPHPNSYRYKKPTNAFSIDMLLLLLVSALSRRHLFVFTPKTDL